MRLSKTVTMAQEVLLAVREGRSACVVAPDEVAVARVLRSLGATTEEMRRIRFSHVREDLERKAG